MSDGGPRSDLQAVVHTAHRRFMACISRDENVVHADIEILAGTDSHFDADRGVNPQMAVQFVGQHARPPFAQSVTGNRRVDDRNDIRRIECAADRESRKTPGFRCRLAPENRRQSCLRLRRRALVRQFARPNRPIQFPDGKTAPERTDKPRPDRP